MAEVLNMGHAVAENLRDGDTLAIEGFTALICFAAAHEVIRQGFRELTLCRMTPDLVYDQMVAAGCARKLVFSYLGNPGIGSLHCIRRAVEGSVPGPLELEEYTHFGMVGRYLAGASNLPFFPLRSFTGSQLPEVNPRLRTVQDPYGSGPISVVPPLKPDLTILHAQRADPEGNVQMWGLEGVQREAALAADRVIVVVEELVDTRVIRQDPNRTALPAGVVDAIVVEPKGAHPSYVQGYWDRDNDFYWEWDRISRDHEQVLQWLERWVFGVNSREEYARGLPEELWRQLKPASRPSSSIDYGEYR